MAYPCGRVPHLQRYAPSCSVHQGLWLAPKSSWASPTVSGSHFRSVVTSRTSTRSKPSKCHDGVPKGISCMGGDPADGRGSSDGVLEASRRGRPTFEVSGVESALGTGGRRTRGLAREFLFSCSSTISDSDLDRLPPRTTYPGRLRHSLSLACASTSARCRVLTCR